MAGLRIRLSSLFVLAIATIVLQAGAPAKASSRCSSIEEGAAYLLEEYDEKQIATAIAQDPRGQDRIIHIYASFANRTYTITVVTPDGQGMCVLIAGTNIELDLTSDLFTTPLPIKPGNDA